jgi:hypothetical protein
MVESDAGANGHRWRDLTTLTRVLAIASAISLFFHLVRAIFSTAPDIDAASLAATGLPVTPGVDLALQISIFVCAGLGLAWLHGASVNAHILRPRMKYSPGASVAWFFVPALNIIMIMAVVYEIWSASGGDKKGGRLVMVWWALVVLAIHGDVVWLAGVPRPWLIQIVVVGATLSFLLLARRIVLLQAVGAAGEVFGDASDVDDGPETAAFSPVDTNPQPSLEMFEPAGLHPKEYTVGPSPGVAKVHPIGRVPAPILVRRPEAGAKDGGVGPDS